MWLTLILLAMAILANPTVTVMTDRGWYGPGDQVIVQVTASGMSRNETLWVYVDKPDGRNLYFAELPPNGGTINVALPQDAADGLYTVTVTWDHRYVETGFVVESQPIPEFPFTPLVFFVAFTIATLAISRRQASARSKAIASHP